MHKLAVLIIALSLSNPAFSLNLQEALTHGYHNNDDLKTIRTNFIDEIEAFPRAFSSFMPSVNLNVSKSNSKTKYSPRYSLPSRETDNQYGTLQITQPLFNGGSSIAALKSAQSSFRVSRAKYYAKEQDTISNLIDSYLDYFEAKEKYEISASRLRASIQLVRTVEEKLKLGEATEIDIATAKAGLAETETKQLSAYADFQTKKAVFIKDFGVEPVNITLPPLPDNLPISLAELTKRALIVNPNIDAAIHNVQATKASEMVEKGKLLPQVKVTMQSGKTYYNPENLELQNVNNKSISTVLSVDVPIYPEGGAQYSNIRKAKNRTRIEAIKLDGTIKQIKAAVISIWEKFKAAKSSITASEQRVEAAQISYDGTAQEEIVGSKTILDVLQAEEKLYDAKIARVQAMKSSIAAAYQMKSLIGELTAKSLKLKVKYFSPEEEFKNIKKKLVIGF